MSGQLMATRLTLNISVPLSLCFCHLFRVDDEKELVHSYREGRIYRRYSLAKNPGLWHHLQGQNLALMLYGSLWGWCEGGGPILKDGYTDYMCMCVCMYGMAPIKIDHFLSSYCTQYYLRGTIQEVLVCGTWCLIKFTTCFSYICAEIGSTQTGVT